MKLRCRALVLSTLVICVFLYTGCAPTNEEELKGKSEALGPQPGVPQMKTYAEATKYMQEQQAAKNKEAKQAAKKSKP